MAVKMNLNLDKANSLLPVAIFHSFFYKGIRHRISTGERIEAKHWDSRKDKQKVKKTNQHFNLINDTLGEQQDKIITIIRNLVKFGHPVTKERIVWQLDWLSKVEPTTAAPLAIYSLFLIEHCKPLSASTLKSYNTTFGHLKGYQEKKGIVFSFQHFTKDFGELFKTYLLQDVGVFDNMVSKQIKQLKTYLKWAKDKGYNNTDFYNDWTHHKEDGKEVFFLKFDEVLKIAETTFIERLEKVKHLFLIGCYTGLRYGDILALKPQHLQDRFIKMPTQKTNEHVKIFIIPELQKILDFYFGANKPLPTITNQKGNVYIKELVKQMGFKRTFNYIQTINEKAVQTEYEAWEMCSWHTARHSWATHAAQRKVALKTISETLGHKTLKQSEQYMQKDDEFNSIEMMKMSNPKS